MFYPRCFVPWVVVASVSLVACKDDASSAADGGTAFGGAAGGGAGQSGGGAGSGNGGAGGTNGGSSGSGSTSSVGGGKSVLFGADPSVVVNDVVGALCARADELGLLDMSLADCRLGNSQPCEEYALIEDADDPADCLKDAAAWTPDIRPPIWDLVSCKEASVRARMRLLGTGTLADKGQACGDGILCAQDMQCTHDRPEECGVCDESPWANVGEPCTDKMCIEGYCDGGSKTCVAYQQTVCTKDDDCIGPPYVCNLVSGECEIPVSPDGSACNYDSECASERCRERKCVSRSALGEACEVDEDCRRGLCRAGTCLLDVSCALPEAGLKTVGEVCSTSEECQSRHCAFAGGGEGKCALAPIFTECDEDSACASGKCIGNECAGAGSCAAK